MWHEIIDVQGRDKSKSQVIPVLWVPNKDLGRIYSTKSQKAAHLHVTKPFKCLNTLGAFIWAHKDPLASQLRWLHMPKNSSDQPPKCLPQLGCDPDQCQTGP